MPSNNALVIRRPAKDLGVKKNPTLLRQPQTHRRLQTPRLLSRVPSLVCITFCGGGEKGRSGLLWSDSVCLGRFCVYTICVQNLHLVA